jgi:hypothetical protein
MNSFKNSLAKFVCFFAFLLCYQPHLLAIPSIVSSTTESYVEATDLSHCTIEHTSTKNYLFGIPFITIDTSIKNYSLKPITSDPNLQVALDVMEATNSILGTNHNLNVSMNLEELHYVCCMLTLLKIFLLFFDKNTLNRNALLIFIVCLF